MVDRLFDTSSPEGQVPLRQVVVEARVRLGLTQKQVAEAAGITQSALSRFESGLETSISGETLKRVHKAIIEAAIDKANRETADQGSKVFGTTYPGFTQIQAQLKAKHFLVDLNKELQDRLEAKRKQDQDNNRLVEEFADLQAKAEKFDGLESKVQLLEQRIARLEAVIQVKAKGRKRK